MTDQEITRLAPSPTGALHLGNARTFLLNWAIARKLLWKIMLRIEDLDGPRIKLGAAEGIKQTLGWLGMDWDGPVLVQSEELGRPGGGVYGEAMRRLIAEGHAFSSTLSRGDIESGASAPQEGSGEVRFPPELRPGWLACAASESTARAAAIGDEQGRFEREGLPESPETQRSGGEAMTWRLATPAGPVEVADDFVEPARRVVDPSAGIGDFIIWTKRRSPAYQLAVVVDDARQRVTRIVRGDDLLESAGRQAWIYERLGLWPRPRYVHLPLVIGQDGRRLAKRHGDTRVETYRAAGVPAEAIVGLVAHWSGVLDRRAELSASELVSAVDVGRIPRTPVVFGAEDHAWLMSRCRRSKG